MSEQVKTDYYEVLGVGKDANAEEIKKAFRKMAKKNHPDKGGDEENFKKIGEAYETLSDPEKRQNYDQLGQRRPDGTDNYPEGTVSEYTWHARAQDLSPEDLERYLPQQYEHRRVWPSSTPKEWLDSVDFENGVSQVLTKYNNYCDEKLSESYKIDAGDVRLRIRNDIISGLSPFDNLDEYAINLGEETLESIYEDKRKKLRSYIYGKLGISLTPDELNKYVKGRPVEENPQKKAEEDIKKDLTSSVLERVNIDLISEENAKSHKIKRNPYELLSIDKHKKYVQDNLKRFNWNADKARKSIFHVFNSRYKLDDMKFIIKERGMLNGRVNNFQEWVSQYEVDHYTVPLGAEDRDEKVNLILLNKTLVNILKGQKWDVDNAIRVFEQHIAEAAAHEIVGDEYWSSGDIEKAHEAYSSANRLDSNTRRIEKESEMKARLETPWYGLKCKTEDCKNTYYKGWLGGIDWVGWWTPGKIKIPESKGCREEEGGARCGLVYARLCPVCAKESERAELEIFKGDPQNGGKLMRNKRRKTNKKTKKRSKKSKIKSKRKKSKKNKVK